MTGVQTCALPIYEIEIKGQDQGVVVCPGPNMAYFDQEVSLSKMLQHIYGNASVLRVKDRPNVFVKELRMYLDYFKNELNEMAEDISAPQIKKWNTFKNNLQVGIEYYQNKFATNAYFSTHLNEIKEKLEKYKVELTAIEIPKLELN